SLALDPTQSTDCQRECQGATPAYTITFLARCETACLDCLLTFDAQDAMNQGLLQRRKAYRLLKDLLADGVPALGTTESENTNHSTNEIGPSEAVTNRLLNKEERLLRGRSRLGKQRPHSS